MEKGLLSRTTEKPAFLYNSCKLYIKGPSLYYITKILKLLKQSNFHRIRLAILYLTSHLFVLVP
jgi:hypothetical protein